MSEVMRGLDALEEKLRAAGVDGVYGLLDQLAGQFLGVPRSALPPPIVKQEPVEEPAPEPKSHEAAKHGGAVNHRR